MLHQRLNSLSVQLRLQPTDPLLVKVDPDLVKSDPTRRSNQIPDMRFVRTWRNGRWEPYLPGSSLKGVFRARAEQLARTLNSYEQGACETFGPNACSERADWKDHRPPGPQAYAEACPICKLFGHAYLAARLHFSDAYLVGQTSRSIQDQGWDEPGRQRPVVTMEKRDGVGIDRKRGASAVIEKDDGNKSGAKYDYEVWKDAPFETRLDLMNFELWQVGLLAYLLDDLANGEMRVGYGTRRGLGRVSCTIQALQVTYFGVPSSKPSDKTFPLQGIAGLTKAIPHGQWSDYRLWPEPDLPPTLPGQQHPAALWTEWELNKVGQEQLCATTATLWDAFITACGAPKQPSTPQEASHA